MKVKLEWIFNLNNYLNKYKINFFDNYCDCEYFNIM